MVFKIFNNSFLLIDILKLILASLVVRCKKKEENAIWLISEKVDEARDNGFAFFNYLLENKKNINAYYVISRKSLDEEKIYDKSKIVYDKSWKHFRLYIKSSALISSQLLPFPTKRKICNIFKFLCLNNPKRVWLQHGVVKDLVPHKSMDYDKMEYDLMTCSTTRECEFIKKEYGYPENVAQVLGLCRYDTLVDCSEDSNRILIMPTWRKWLGGKKVQEFKKSNFYINYINLLQNKVFNELLQKSNMKVCFYLHYGFQSYSELFENELSNNSNIIICKADSYDVQMLLRESKLLITDYSSIFWDFAFMRKPTIYFQFDKADYDTGHYPPAYFNYTEDAFGKVTYNINELNYEFSNLLNKKLKIDPVYLNRTNNAFYFRDNKNCDRTFEKIKSLFYESE